MLLVRIASAQYDNRDTVRIPAGVALVDARFRIVHADVPFAAMLGRHGEDLVGLPVKSLLPEFVSAVTALLGESGWPDRLVGAVGPRGETRVVRMSAKLLPAEPSRPSPAAVSRDRDDELPDDGRACATVIALLDALAAEDTPQGRLQRGLDTLAAHWSCACGVALAEPVRLELGLPTRALAARGAPTPAVGVETSAALRAGGDDLGLLWAAGTSAPAELAEIADQLARWIEGGRRAEGRRREWLDLQRSDALKTALLRGVSHEFRGPLTAIANAGAALGVVDEPAKRRLLLDGLLEECGRLERLVDNLLDLSRLEADPSRPRHLLTETGVGYRLLADTAERPESSNGVTA